MSNLTHEQAHQYLHSEQNRLKATERVALANHLTECDTCRRYADQLAVLQPVLSRALPARHYSRYGLSAEMVRHIQQKNRRVIMQKQVLITIGALISVVALVIAAQFFARTISVQSSSPTLTTVTRMVSTSISISGADRFEPNNGFDQATPIELGVEYGNLNFVEFTPSENSSDRDYFKTQIKQGMLITCRTFNLSPGTNTNLILYDQSQHGIIGNDDVNRATGDLISSVTYLATYDGWLYIQVGEGVQRTLEEASRATYSMECTFNK